MPNNRKSRLVALVVALVFYVVFIFRTSFVVAGTRYFVLFEDAMISMRYAKHFADGDGLTWNVGEAPIEGFTNLLWTLWMSVAHKLGLAESKISLFIMLTGVAILLANGVVVSKIARKISDSPWVPLAALVAVLFDYPLVFWTLRGMEVGALSLVVYTLLWLTLENEEKFSFPRTVLMSVLMGAALLLRSDSVVPLALIGLYGLYTAEKRILFLSTMAVGPVVALAAQFISRDRYFHEKLPNTYYLKLGHIPLSARVKRGAFVALDVLAFHLAVPLAAVFAGVLGIKKDFYKDRAMRRKVLLFAMFIAQIGYATYVGGDAWEWMLYANRYMCVGMPALILLVCAVLAEVVTWKREARAVYVKRFSSMLILAGALLIVLNLYARMNSEHGIAATIVFSKTAFAFGAGFVGLGLLLKLKDSQRGLSDGIAALGQRLATKSTASRTAVILMVIVWLPCHALPLARWAMTNAAQWPDEARYTRLGLVLRATTPDDFRIAVAAAGATPYFSARPTEDLLGKNDRVIARLAPRGVFSPGHDKWDYHYSLGERNSSLIVEAVDTNAEDSAYMDSLGFEQMPNEMRIRKGVLTGEKRELLGEEVPDPTALASILERANYTLPEAYTGRDIGMVSAFALLIMFLFRAGVKDTESYAKLADEKPETDIPEEEPLPKGDTIGREAHQIPTLDGMRGIAVLTVLAFHFAWTFPGDDPDTAVTVMDKIAVRLHDFLWSGWIGVDLFFVLSGFLITRGLVAPSKKPLGTRMRMFWMRRVLRIFPLYYAVLIVGAIICLVLGTWTPTLAYWFYMQNYALVFDTDVLRWTAHFWSLAIEEQFYFVWPIVALATPKKKLLPIILLVIVMCVALRAGITMKAHFWDPETIKTVYRATFTRCDGLLMGALVAVLQREHDHPLSYAWRRMRFPVFVGSGLALLGLYVMAHGLNDYDRRIMVIGYFALAVFFASAVSLCADGVISERTRKIMSSKLLVACGKVSYGMYIFHWMLVIWLVPRLEKFQVNMDVGTRIGLGLAVIVVSTALMYVAAAISYRFFEAPFLKLKGKFHG